VLVGQMQHHASLSRDVKHRHPHEGVPPPAGRWRLDPLAFVVWQRRAGLLERVADAGRSGRRDEPADGHHHPQGHETCRFCARARSGHTLGRFEDAAAARGLRLPCVSGPYLERGHLDRVACGRREDDTTVLVDTRLPGRAPRRQGSDALGDALVGLGARARTPPLRRLGGGTDGAVVAQRGGPGVGTRRQGLGGRRCTGTGRAAQRLEGCDGAVPRLAPRRVDGTLGRRLARRGREAPPAWRAAPIARWHHVRARARRARCQRLGIGLGQGVLGGVPGPLARGGSTGDWSRPAVADAQRERAHGRPRDRGGQGLKGVGFL
jgi:hypothetical protein